MFASAMSAVGVQLCQLNEPC